MGELDGLICAYRIKSDMTAERLASTQLNDGPRSDEWIWLHFDVAGSQTHELISRQLGQHPHAVEALLANETRPRATMTPLGSLIILRGVNLQPHSDPTDMISIRLWVEPNRIISARMRPLLSISAIRERCDNNDGPRSVGEFIVDLHSGLVDRMAGVIQSLDEEIDELEELASKEAPSSVRPLLVSTRQKIIPLRRFLSPQRDAITQLLTARVDWLEDWHRGQLRESGDRLTRYVEELDAMREKAAVVQDTVANLLAEQMNRTMLVLSIVAAIFLPLGLLTGLLGINVGGMPGSESAYGFWVVVLLMLVLAGAEIWLFRKLGLLGERRSK